MFGWYQETMPSVPIHRYDEYGIIHVIAQAKVDQLDFARVTSNYKWFQHARTHQVFATHTAQRVYLQDVIKGRKGPWAHVNGDPWDFTNKNLVEVTTNIRTVKRKNGTARAVGVCFVESRNRWKATLSGKLIGYFKTEAEATGARLKKVLSLNPMVKFVREGENPGGKTGMHNPNTDHAQGGKPDAYLDPDDAEEAEIPRVPYKIGTDFLEFDRRPTWAAIPHP
jgi:hypothetical protein